MKRKYRVIQYGDNEFRAQIRFSFLPMWLNIVDSMISQHSYEEALEVIRAHADAVDRFPITTYVEA